MDNTLCCTISFLHRVIFLLKLIELSLEVEVFLLLHYFTFFSQVVIFREQSLCLVVNKVAENLEGVVLFDLFALKKFSDLSNPLSDII